MTRTVRVAVMMKALAESKSRLSPALDREQRELLSLAMFLQTLPAARGAGELVVIGGDLFIEAVTRRCDGRWLPDAGGLNASVQSVIEAGPANGTVVCLPADLPLIEAADIEALIEAAGTGKAVIAPDRFDQGTNALALPAGSGFRPFFGNDSFQLHCAEARSRSLEPVIVRRPGLSLDVDNPDDLAVLLSQRPRWWQEARQIVSESSAVVLGQSEPPTPSDQT